MRVAYVCLDPGVPVFGRKGCSIHVQEIIRAMHRWGATVELFATRLGGPAPSDLRSVRIRRVPLNGTEGIVARERALQEANIRLPQMLRQADCFNLVYERHSLFSDRAMQFTRTRGVPCVLEVNSPLVEEQSRHRELVDLSAAKESARRSFAAASTLIAVSREVASYLQRFCDAGRVHVVSNGVDPRRFARSGFASRGGTPERLENDGSPATSAKTQNPCPFTIGFVGSLKPWHGVEVLIDAIAELTGNSRRTRARSYTDVSRRLPPEHSDLRLLVVGNGSMRERLQQQAQRLGVADCIEFTGSVPPDQIPSLLASIDVAVAPYPDSRDFYFSPLKLFEYMAAGLPLVATRLGQITEVIEDGVNGVLCTPGDAGELATSIRRLRADHGLRKRLGQTARRTVLQQHTWDHVLARILSHAGISCSAASI